MKHTCTGQFRSPREAANLVRAYVRELGWVTQRTIEDGHGAAWFNVGLKNGVPDVFNITVIDTTVTVTARGFTRHHDKTLGEVNLYEPDSLERLAAFVERKYARRLEA